jgi:PAS domain-containing protein
LQQTQRFCSNIGNIFLDAAVSRIHLGVDAIVSLTVDQVAMPSVTSPFSPMPSGPDFPAPTVFALTVDPDGGIVEADPGLCRLLGQPAGPAVLSGLLLPAETAALIREFLDGTEQTGIVPHCLPLPGRAARPAVLILSRQPGRVAVHVAIPAEFTGAPVQETAAETSVPEMLAQAEILSAMLGTAPEAFWCIEYEEPVELGLPEETVIDQFFHNACCWRACNPAMAQLYRLPDGVDFHDQPVSRYFPETTVNRAMLRDLMRAGYALDGAVALDQRHDGSEMLVVNSFRARVENGQLLRMWGTVRDISTERAREEDLASRASEMLGILTALPDAVIVTGQEAGILAVNPAAERMLGTGLRLGQSLQAAGFPEETVRRLREMAVLGNDDTVALRLRRGEIWQLRAALAEGAEGRLVITARRQSGRGGSSRRQGGSQ